MNEYFYFWPHTSQYIIRFNNSHQNQKKEQAEAPGILCQKMRERAIIQPAGDILYQGELKTHTPNRKALNTRVKNKLNI